MSVSRLHVPKTPRTNWKVNGIQKNLWELYERVEWLGPCHRVVEVVEEPAAVVAAGATAEAVSGGLDPQIVGGFSD